MVYLEQVLELRAPAIRYSAMRFIVIFAGIAALAGCNRSISETGSNASADARQLGAIKAEDHSREFPVAPRGGQAAIPIATVAVTQSPPVQH